MNEMYSITNLDTCPSSSVSLASPNKRGSGVRILLNWSLVPDVSSDNKGNVTDDIGSLDNTPWDSTEILKKACSLSRKEHRSDFVSKFLEVIHYSDFEYGFTTPADEYIREALDSYGTFAREWINEVFLASIHDPFVTCSILRILAHFDYSQIYPQGMTMAAAAISNKDMMVRECAIRCFENWEEPETIKILQSVSISEKWLREYLEAVISDLGNINRHVASCSEN